MIFKRESGTGLGNERRAETSLQSRAGLLGAKERREEEEEESEKPLEGC